MRTQILFITMLLVFSSAIQAQQLGLGYAKNHTSNGIHLSYSPQWKDQWILDLGLRITVNTHNGINNDQYFAYYQTGYASTFPEFFSLNFRIDRRLFRYKWFRLGVMSNLHLTCESIVSKIHSYRQDTVTQEWRMIDDVVYVKPSPAVELTIGPQLTVDLHKRITLTATAGFGIIYMHHSHEGWLRMLQEKTELFNSNTPNWRRGGYEFVSTDKLSMWSIAVKYKLR